MKPKLNFNKPILKQITKFVPMSFTTDYEFEFGEVKQNRINLIQPIELTGDILKDTDKLICFGTLQSGDGPYSYDLAIKKSDSNLNNPQLIIIDKNWPALEQSLQMPLSVFWEYARDPFFDRLEKKSKSVNTDIFLGTIKSTYGDKGYVLDLIAGIKIGTNVKIIKTDKREEEAKIEQLEQELQVVNFAEPGYETGLVLTTDFAEVGDKMYCSESFFNNIDDNDLQAKVAALLDRLIKAQRVSNDNAEIIYDDVFDKMGELPKTGLVDAIKKAVKTKPSRKKHLADILGIITDVPGVQELMAELINDLHNRSSIIQSIGLHKLESFAPLLNPIILKDSDVREHAIQAALMIKSPVNLPALLQLVKEDNPNYRSQLIWALRAYAQPECEEFLSKNFNKPQDKGDKVIAAWGLGKMGNSKAINYLMKMLYDTNIKKPGVFIPGKSSRALQALCDIYKLPYENYVEEIRDNISKLVVARLKEKGLPK